MQERWRKTTDFDSIIVGGGHNGLGLACYLARSGFRVLVLEALPQVGGCLNTEEVIPGYRHSLHAITIGTYPPIYRDFDLAKYVNMIKADTEIGLLVDKHTLVIQNGQPKVNHKTFSKFSERDSRTLALLHKKFRNTWYREYYSPPLPLSERGKGLAPEDRREWQRLCSMSPREVIEEYFSSEMVRLFLSLRIVEEAGQGLGMASKKGRREFRGTGDYAMKMMIDPGYAIPQGGSRMLAEGLARMLGDLGGMVITNAPVVKIIIKEGRATGVVLADGRTIGARKMVVSRAGILATLKLVGEEQEGGGVGFNAKIAKKIRSVKPTIRGDFDLHIATTQPPVYSKADSDEINRCLTVYLGYEALEDIDKHFDEARRGEFPRNPAFQSGCQTLYDPTLAPPGRHTLWEWLDVSPVISGGLTRDDVPKYREAVLARWREFAPNLKDKEVVLDAYAYFVRKYRIRMLPAALSNGQHHDGRPIPELSQYRTPIQKLYLCHWDCHPGGSVRFGPCYNAFSVIAKDFGIKRWWGEDAAGGPLTSE